MRFLIVFCICISLSEATFCQNNLPKITWYEIFEKAIDPNVEDTVLVFDGYEIVDEAYYDENSSRYEKTLKLKLTDNPYVKLKDNKVVINKDIEIKNSKANFLKISRLHLLKELSLDNVEFTDEWLGLSIDSSYFNSLHIFSCKMNSNFHLINSGFNSLTISILSSDLGSIQNCEVNSYIQLRSLEFEMFLNIYGNIFNVLNEISNGVEIFDFPDSLDFGRDLLPYGHFRLSGHFGYLDLDENIFNISVAVLEGSGIDNLYIQNNTFEGILSIENSLINNRLLIEKNSFKDGVNFQGTIFPEFYNFFNWNQISSYDKKITTLLPTETYERLITQRITYKGENSLEMANDKEFFNLLYQYQQFYDTYKRQGNIESANAVYVDIKDLQTRRYKYLYDQDGTLKSWFRWKLNQLLKTYIAHGTDPAKALVISFYIILGFAVFYFFFPSDWDVSSKSVILANMSLAIRKDEKTVAPVFKALGYIFLSFINAFTLSLNAFTTLGFGNIPTSGLARYVTILQGFLGWFMLSL